MIQLILIYVDFKSYRSILRFDLRIEMFCLIKLLSLESCCMMIRVSKY